MPRAPSLNTRFANNFTGKIDGLYCDMGWQTIGFTSPLTAFIESATLNYKGELVRAKA